MALGGAVATACKIALAAMATQLLAVSLLSVSMVEDLSDPNSQIYDGANDVSNKSQCSETN